MTAKRGGLTARGGGITTLICHPGLRAGAYNLITKMPVLNATAAHPIGPGSGAGVTAKRGQLTARCGAITTLICHPGLRSGAYNLITKMPVLNATAVLPIGPGSGAGVTR